MNPIDNLFEKIETATVESLKKVLIIICSIVFFLAFIGLYRVRYNQYSMIEAVKKAISNNTKINNLISKKMSLDQEKEAWAKEYEGLSERNLVNIIEKVLQENKIELDQPYKDSLKTVQIPFEEDFIEQQITIRTENLNLKNFINLIDSLRKENFVMFREVKIENKGKTPVCQALVTMRKKK